MIFEDEAEFDPAMDVLDYFHLADALDVTWSHATNSHRALDAALASVLMLEGDITLRWAGLPNQVSDSAGGCTPLGSNASCCIHWS